MADYWAPILILSVLVVVLSITDRRMQREDRPRSYRLWKLSFGLGGGFLAVGMLIDGAFGVSLPGVPNWLQASFIVGCLVCEGSSLYYRRQWKSNQSREADDDESGEESTEPAGSVVAAGSDPAAGSNEKSSDSARKAEDRGVEELLSGEKE